MKKFLSTRNHVGPEVGRFCFTKIFGRFISLSVSMKAKRKKQDKKKK